MIRAPIVGLVLMIAAAVTGCGAGSDDFVDIPGIGSTRIDVARPTGPASAPCDADPLPGASSETIDERVAALRAIGLFADRPTQSTDEIAIDVEAAIDEAWGELADEALPLLDLIVAEQDRARVWSTAGPVTVAVTLEGAALEVRPVMLEDWIDPGILVDLNTAIGEGRRFEMYKAFDQTAFVMALTEPERVALEARGWCFE